MAITPPGRRSAAQRALITGCAAALLAGALPPPVRAQNQLPALGDAVSEDFDVGIERRLGDQIMRSVRRDPDYLDDPVLLDYVQSLWQPLVAVARNRGEIDADISQRFAWEPFLVRDRGVNAFALPGGFIGVYLGLVAVTGSSDELASVLAHELSHVTQRHIARGLVNSRRQSLLSAAAMILGVLAASRARSGDAANAVIAGGQAASIQGQLNFSRDMEREADRIGYTLLTEAGFAPGGMAAMFEKLEQASRLNDSGGFPYLRSHPLTTERIGEARARLGSHPRPPPAAQFEHTLAQARARVLMDTRVQSLQRWQALDDSAPRQLPEGADVSEALAAAASGALASTLLRDWPRADASLARADVLLRAGLRHTDPAAAPRARARRMLVMLAAQSQLERGDAAAAAATLATAPGTGDSGGRAALLLGAQIALAAAGASAAAQGSAGAPGPAAAAELNRQAGALQTWVANHPQDAAGWNLLARVWAALGHPLRAVRAEAEGRYAIGDLTGAVDRLRAGQREAREGSRTDFIESSVIDARLRDIETERRREMAEREAQRGG